MKRPAHGILPLVLIYTGTVAYAQFKEVGPPPFTPVVARQKIRTSIGSADPANPQRTVDALFALVPWYRDIVDQELIAAWKTDARAKLPQVIQPLADAAVASAIVEYSWRQAPEAAFTLAYAPLLGQLMARYAESAQPFLADLRGSPPDLAPPVAEAVCRILIDMPDLGTWRKEALKILPHYRQAAEKLLAEDRRGDDQEKSYRAQRWLAELNSDQPGASSQQSLPRRRPAVSQPTVPDRPPPSAPRTAAPPLGTADGRPTLARAEPPPAPSSSPTLPAAPAAPAPPTLYGGPHSGTLECTGNPVPQNAEYVFRNLPPGKMQLDYDTKVWDARLAPGEGQTQKLILHNKSSGPQKRCSVHWSVSP